MADTKSIAVIGGGLVGSLQTIFMAKEGYDVHLYDNREDLRATEQPAGRSINLALSYRGIQALQQVGLDDKVLTNAIPMRARMIHPVGRPTYPVPYGTRGECINSIDRKKLNELLLSEAESLPNVTLHFQHKLTKINFESMRFTFADTSTPVPQEVVAKHDFVFGCDGAFSTVRRQMMRQSPINFAQEYIEHGYKELTMPPTKDGDYAMEPNYLHIWAKGTFMMIALPNLDRSFTLTLFMPYSIFAEIETEEDVLDFFNTQFPDAVPKIGEEELVREFFQNPTSSLISVKCRPHHIDDNAVLLGDAAHAVVPFYGQGMNCGFEDCLVFLESLKKCENNLVAASKLYSDTRIPDAHAICDLSMYNYIEMRSHVNSWSFLMKKKIVTFLHYLFPRSVLPLYTMVAFTRIPYHIAVLRNRKQERALSVGLRFGCFSAFVVAAILAIRFLPRWLTLPWRMPKIRFSFEF
jgi:kynurenine 3-monooxygenase